MKKVTSGLVMGLLCCSAWADAEAPAGTTLTGNITLTTDYLYRGISQTTGDAALQGGLDLNHESGFYLGVWGSNVDFADSLELDYYAGYSTELNADFSADLGVIYYDYPSDPSEPQGDFLEYYGSLSWRNITLGINYSDDFFAETGEALYYYGSYQVQFPRQLSMAVTLAKQQFDKATFGNDDSYLHYGVTFTTQLLGVELGLTWSDTDISKGDCAGAGFSRNDCAATVVFSLTKSM